MAQHSVAVAKMFEKHQGRGLIGSQILAFGTIKGKMFCASSFLKFQAN